MNMQTLNTLNSRGIMLEVRGRCYTLGLGFDKKRRVEFKHRHHKLSTGFTGNFSLGKLWLFYGTWRTA